jgi:hypothetical protein
MTPKALPYNTNWLAGTLIWQKRVKVPGKK